MKVKCIGVKRGCSDMSCHHRRKHAVVRDPSKANDNAVSCQAYINCHEYCCGPRVRCVQDSTT